MSVEKNTHTIPARKDVPVSDTWDLAAMYASESEWESDFNLLKASVEEAATYRGTLGSSSQALLSALKWLAKTSLVAVRFRLLSQPQFPLSTQKSNLLMNPCCVDGSLNLNSPISR